MYLQLEGQAHDEQGSKAGKYTKAYGLSSGLPYWMQSDGTNALWFTSGNWMIGEKSDLGTTTKGLDSTNSPPCPESIGSHWKYYDGEEWLEAQGNATVFEYEGMIYQGNKQFINDKNNLNSN